jgi:hypothetical protein
MDESFESFGVKLFVDPLSFQYLDGTEIDYVENPHGAGFKFNNPNISVAAAAEARSTPEQPRSRRGAGRRREQQRDQAGQLICGVASGITCYIP